MKRYLSLLTMCLLAAGSAFVSCVEPVEPDDTDTPSGTETVTPVFPDAITQTIEANGTYTIELEPNVDWSIELKYDSESAGWFWIKDNDGQFVVRGKAGKKTSVTVCTSDKESFDVVHSCTLEMTMGEETKTIATFNRGLIDRTFSLMYCKVEESDGLVYDYAYNEDVDSDLKYAYEAAAGDGVVTIPLAWLERTQDYRRSVLISANFDWRLKSKPDWMKDLEITGAGAGEQVEFDLEGDPMAYPLEDTEAELVFCAKDNPDADSFVFKVAIPGCGGIFRISGFTEETKVNVAGEIYKNTMGEDTWTDAEVGLTGSVLSQQDVKVYVFSYAEVSPLDPPMWDSASENIEWLTVSLAPWNEDGEVLQNRSLNLKVAENTGKERQAYVLVMPGSEAPEYDYSIFPDGQNMDGKYAEYVVSHIVQEGVNEPDPDVPEEPETGSEVEFATPGIVTGAVLEHVTEENLADMKAKYPKLNQLDEQVAGNKSDVSILTYTSEYPENAALVIPAHYHMDRMPGTGAEWLSYNEPVEADEKFQMLVQMARPETGAAEFGFVNIFKTQTSSNPEIIIYCIPEFAAAEEGPVDPDPEPDPDPTPDPEPDPDPEPEPEITSSISFVALDQVVGATLNPVAKSNLAKMIEKYPELAGELKENVDGMEIDVVILSYTSENPENVALNVPKYAWIDVKPGMDGPEWLSYSAKTVDGQKQITVEMTKPADGQAVYGIMNFFESYTASKQTAIIYCIPEF